MPTINKRFIDAVSGAAHAVGRGAAAVGRPVGRFAKNTADGAAEAVGETIKANNKVGSKVADTFVGSMIKETDPNLSNGYLGLKPSAWGNTAVIGAAVGYAGIGSLSAIHQGSRNNGDISYQGAPPIFAGDGIANTSSAPNLGANGSMVFGLHSMRRG